MNDLNKIIAECYSIIHLSVGLQNVADDYRKIIIPAAPKENQQMLKESYHAKYQIIQETAMSLSKVSEKLADFCNNNDIVDDSEDGLVQKFFEYKS